MLLEAQRDEAAVRAILERAVNLYVSARELVEFKIGTQKPQLLEAMTRGEATKLELYVFDRDLRALERKRDQAYAFLRRTANRYGISVQVEGRYAELIEPDGSR